MKRGKVFPGILLILLVLFSCTQREVLPAKSVLPEASKQEIQDTARESGELEWEKTLAQGRKEGMVLFYSSAGSAVRNALVPTFKKATGINLEMIIGRGSELAAKILNERRAGLFLADVYSGGLDTIITYFKPAGILEPIRPYLLLEEVTNPNLWYKNELNYADKDKTYIISYTSSTSGGSRSIINTDMVKADELTSYYDYLKPRWKGKLSMKDPTQEGKGLNWFHLILRYKKLDIDYMKELARTEPMITRDERLQLEWLVRGKYPITLNVSPEPVSEFRQMGFPLAEISLKEDLNTLTAGAGGNITVIKKAPHPDAAKVFLNWLLTKEGQTIYARAAGVQSRRLDTPADHLLPDRIRDPKSEYIIADDEDLRSSAPEYAKLSLEIFGPLLR